MPISATGIWSKRTTAGELARGRGFTLLELLVVVAIIGIFVGVAVLSTDLVSFDRKLQQEASRLGTLVGFLGEESLMQTQDYGIVFYREGYEFVWLTDQQVWLPFAVAGIEQRVLGEDIAMRLRVEERDVELDLRCETIVCNALPADDGDEPAGAVAAPQVVLLSSGQTTPFAIEFYRESEPIEPGFSLSVEFNGRTEVSRDEI